MQNSSIMIIRDEKKLYEWVVNFLDNWVEAEPKILADYVFALLKKKLPTEEALKDYVQERLEEFFIGAEIGVDHFVKKLFEIIEKQNDGCSISRRNKTRDSKHHSSRKHRHDRSTPESCKNNESKHVVQELLNARKEDVGLDTVKNNNDHVIEVITPSASDFNIKVPASESSGSTVCMTVPSEVMTDPSVTNTFHQIDTTGSCVPLELSSSVKEHCKDFHGKGFCTSGNMCPYDHGIDYVEMDGASCVPDTYNFCDSEFVSEYSEEPEQIITMQNNYLQTSPLFNAQCSSYNGVDKGASYSAIGRNTGLVTSAVAKRTHTLENYTGEGNKKKKFDFNRLGAAKYSKSNRSLELKKIPAHLNNIRTLNNYFLKFGKITNLQVCYNGDPQAALITFSTHFEANSAYRSKEAILNNRFIKTFWHTDSENESVVADNAKQILQGSHNFNVSQAASHIPTNVSHTHATLQVSATTILGPYTLPSSRIVSSLSSSHAAALSDSAISYGSHLKTTKVKYSHVPTNICDSHTTLQVSAATFVSSSSTIPSTTVASLSSLHEPGLRDIATSSFALKATKMKDAQKINIQLNRCQQKLLEKLLEEQRSLITKLEYKEFSSPQQRSVILDAVNELQEKIDKVRGDLKTHLVVEHKQHPVSPVSSSSVKKLMKEMQREILDTELDLLKKQNSGVDVTDLKKKLVTLEKHFQSMNQAVQSPSGY